MSTAVNWGVLGAAAIAVERTMPGMQQAASVNLLAIASRDKTKSEAVAAEFGIPRAYGSYDDLLADPDIDAVYVSLPNQLHVPWATRAMEAGKHVLCEKPLSTTIDGVNDLRGTPSGCGTGNVGLRTRGELGDPGHRRRRAARPLRAGSLSGSVRAIRGRSPR